MPACHGAIRSEFKTLPTTIKAHVDIRILCSGYRAGIAVRARKLCFGALLAPLFDRETYLKDGNWVGESFEIERSLGIELKALPDTEFTYGCRNGNPSWRGHSAKSCGQLNRRPEQVSALSNWLPDADANPKANGRLCMFIPITQRALNTYGRRDSSRHRRKRRHDPVARVLDLASTLVFQCGSNDIVVFTNNHHEPVVA